MNSVYFGAGGEGVGNITVEDCAMGAFLGAYGSTRVLRRFPNPKRFLRRLLALCVTTGVGGGAGCGAGSGTCRDIGGDAERFGGAGDGAVMMLRGTNFLDAGLRGGVGSSSSVASRMAELTSSSLSLRRSSSSICRWIVPSASTTSLILCRTLLVV